MTRFARPLSVLLPAVIAFGLAAPAGAAPFDIARIYIEYNQSGNDLGFHVFLDAEDWTSLRIENPAGDTIFEVTGSGGYADLGLTELFFEGAEPSLADVPLGDLLALFPEGKYKIIGETVDAKILASNAVLSHAIPDGPSVSAEVDGDSVVISWEPVVDTPDGFPNKAINIVGYQIIVGSFQVTLPASSTEVTLPAEFVASLKNGEHDFEVLAIDASGNQTITEGAFDVE